MDVLQTERIQQKDSDNCNPPRDKDENEGFGSKEMQLKTS
jgi:hypothetical protein